MKLNQLLFLMNTAKKDWPNQDMITAPKHKLIKVLNMVVACIDVAAQSSMCWHVFFIVLVLLIDRLCCPDVDLMLLKCTVHCFSQLHNNASVVASQRKGISFFFHQWSEIFPSPFTVSEPKELTGSKSRSSSFPFPLHSLGHPNFHVQLQIVCVASLCESLKFGFIVIKMEHVDEISVLAS